MDGGGICLESLWAVLNRQQEWFVQARKESGSELGAPWVPPPAGPCPHPFGVLPCRGSAPSPEPPLGSGKGAERNLVSGK